MTFELEAVGQVNTVSRRSVFEGLALAAPYQPVGYLKSGHPRLHSPARRAFIGTATQRKRISPHEVSISGLIDCSRPMHRYALW